MVRREGGGVRGKGRRGRGGGRDREGRKSKGEGVGRGRETKEEGERVIDLLPLSPDTFKKMSRGGSSVHLSRDDVS